MLINAAEESYQRGVKELNQGRNREAMAFFSGAIEIEKRIGSQNPQARYLSYYGLCLSLNGGSPHEAVRACRTAAKMEGYRSDVCWNLGRVLLRAERRREAHEAFRWGLKMQPDHQGIIKDLKRMGLRRKRALPFLGRKNPVNVLLGRLRKM